VGTIVNNGTAKKGEVPQNLAQLIWQIADLLRGPYRPAQYGGIVLPFTVLRRLDCVLEPTKDAVLKAAIGIASAMNWPQLCAQLCARCKKIKA
jgi:type I restriction-modification system DNA methylase subunit